MGIYLNIRQVSTTFGVDGVLPQNNAEQWQNCFNNVAPGLALIPRSLRHDSESFRRTIIFIISLVDAIIGGEGRRDHGYVSIIKAHPPISVDYVI